MPNQLLFSSGPEVTINSVGKGVVKSLIDVNQCREINQGLLEAQKTVSLNHNLHLIYIVTLLEDTELMLRQMQVYSFQQLDEREVSAAESFGIKYRTINTYMIGGKPSLEIRRFISIVVYEFGRNELICSAWLISKFLYDSTIVLLIVLFRIFRHYLDTNKVSSIMSSISYNAKKLN